MRRIPYLHRLRRRGRPAFTLVELLIVIAIILLASLVALPAIYSSLSGRQVTDAARIFSGSLVGARDSAIRYNQPRGIRLLPDPVLTIPPPGQPGAGSLQLVYNRIIPIEPAGDFAQGRLTIGPQVQAGAVSSMPNFPPFYAYPGMPATPTDRYPFPASPTTGNLPTIPQVLMVEESPYANGYVTTGEPRERTNWYWTVRVGDKIKIAGTGRTYTIIGPCVVSPWASGTNQGNVEMFVNVGAPGTVSPLLRTYYTPATPAPTTATDRPEFLFVVNNEDDDHDGYVDDGFDGFNQNPHPPAGPVPPGYPPRNPQPTDNDLIDDPFEWETETWKGTLSAAITNDQPTVSSANSPSLEWATANAGKGTQDLPYVIQRRPVPSEGSREIQLPAGMVIDATTWNSTRERSRIPIQPGSLYSDIMVNPSGLYIPTTQYSTPTSVDTLPFIHFWVTDTTDVFPRGAVWGMTGALPNHNASDPGTGVDDPYVYYELPMTSDTPGYPPVATAPVLKGDRRLITMFAQSGLIVTNTVETIPAPSVVLPGEGFNISSVNNPFLKAQRGLREER